MRRLFLASMLVAAVPAAICAGACGGDDPTTPSSTPPAELDVEDVIYEGGATDEALIALLSATPVTDPAQAAVFSSPTDGAALLGDPPPKLAWHIGGATGRLAPAAPGGARAGEATKPSDAWYALRRLLGAIPAAHAHGTPINGRAYLLVFATAERATVLRVFTTRLDYTPDADAWATLRGAGGAISVSALNAVFENNRVAQGAAPYEGEPVTFTIAP